MKYIVVEEKDNILYITLNRPKSLNALNSEMINEVGDAMKAKESDKNLMGVIITGEGEKAFAAGADIKGFPALDAQTAKELSRSGHEVFNYIESYHIPVIAAVNGYSLGGGCELAMACHMRIAAANAVFGMPEVKLGLIPGYGGTQRLAALIGRAKALEYILTADMIDAATAERLGLANHAVEEGKAVEKAEQIIQKIGKRGPAAISEAIDCVNAFYDEDTDGYALEIERFGELMISEQCKEGVAAFMEKRNPNFRK